MWKPLAGVLAVAVALVLIGPVAGYGGDPHCGRWNQQGTCPTLPPSSPSPTSDPMAIAQTSFAGIGNKTAEAATKAVTNVIAAGSLVTVCIAADNAGTAGVSAISSVTDEKGNTYTPAATVNRTAGSALDGLTVAIYYSILSTALVAGNGVTVNWSPNVTAKAIMVDWWTGSGPAPYESNTANNSGTSFTITSGSLLSGDLIVACAGNESGTAPSADTDTTNGSWTTNGTVVSGGSGGDATKMGLRPSWKIVTGAGAQTFDAATGASTDWGAAYALFRPALSPPFAAKSHTRNALVR